MYVYSDLSSASGASISKNINSNIFVSYILYAMTSSRIMMVLVIAYTCIYILVTYTSTASAYQVFTNTYYKQRLLRLPCINTIKSYDNNINDENSVNDVPKPNVISPNQGARDADKDKFLMMFTCKPCSHRNAHMISKVAYNFGMVVATCRNCKIKHLIADNQKKLDMPEYGSRIEEYLQSLGEDVQKLSITPKELEDNYLVDQDGKLTLVPKILQPPANSNIIDLDMKAKGSRGKGFGV